jgi:flagellar hook-associated protein 2
LIVADVGTTATASSLGLVGSAAAAELTGTQINEVGRATVLAWLNDGNGVRSRDSLNDFRITSAGGGTYDVNISDAVTLGNVIDAINTATGGQVTAAISDDGLGLKLTDAGGGGAGFTVTALNSSNAATDLGILGSDGDSDGVIAGDRLIAGINSKLIRNLNGGAGVTTLGTISITDRAGGGPTAVDLSSAQSIADVIDLINAAGANVTAALNSAGNGLLLTDRSGGSGDIVISDTSGTAAADLGLSGTFSDSDTVDSGNLQFRYITESTRLDALGVSRGKFLITDSAGVSATVDLTQGDEVNIGKVLQEINSRGLQINARINDNGDGIVLEDTGPGVVAIKVEESGSTTAKNLGLLGEAANAGDDLDGSFEKTISFSSPNLAGASTLASLNGGEGVNIKAGSDDLTITTRSGASYSVNLDGATTIDAVITAISTATGGDVTASVNSLSTGLKLTDNTAGASTFTIEAANDSSAGADLGIIGTDSDANGIINGSTIVEVTTLQTLATKINDAKIGISASIISDGSIGTPYRLSLASTTAGSSGAFIFDDGGLGFGATNLSEAQDAVVFFGGNDPTQSLVVTSTSNTLKNVIPGATIDLLATTSTPVQVTIARNDAAIVTSVKGFVDKFNSVMSTINNLDSYDSETKKRGLLLGDSALSQIRSQLFRIVISRNTELSSQYQALAQIGITVGSGAVLQFDETKFGNALATDQDAVKALFTFKETEKDEDGVISVTSGGIGVRIEELLKRLTDSETGPLQTRVDAIEGQIKLNAKRIESLDKLLEAKRARLERQFIAMEKALAGLQDQGSALNGLQNIAANLKNSK